MSIVPDLVQQTCVTFKSMVARGTRCTRSYGLRHAEIHILLSEGFHTFQSPERTHVYWTSFSDHEPVETYRFLPVLNKDAIIFVTIRQMVPEENSQDAISGLKVGHFLKMCDIVPNWRLSIALACIPASLDPEAHRPGVTHAGWRICPYCLTCGFCPCRLPLHHPPAIHVSPLACLLRPPRCPN